MKSQIVLVAALCAATPAVFAQEKKDPAAAAEMPNPKHKEHDLLKQLVGSWDTMMKMEAMPGVPGMEKASESKGTEQSELICDGIWLKSVVNATYQGEPFQGVWVAGYDPHKKEYISVWASSDESEGGACTMNGTYDEKTKTWNWSGKTPHGEMRSVFVFKDADSTVETCYMKGPDGKEAKVMEITRKRSKAPASADASAKAPKNLSKEQTALIKDVGEWDATVKMSPMPGQEAPAEEKATERVTAICQGRWLWSDFKGQMMGAPFEGHGLTGYDPVEKQYVSFWFDSMTPVFAKTAGSLDEAKKTLTLAGNTVDHMGQPMTMKQNLTWKDDNTRVLQMEFKCPDHTGTMEITYKRKK